jgi:hypothetical protein
MGKAFRINTLSFLADVPVQTSDRVDAQVDDRVLDIGDRVSDPEKGGID